MGNNLRERATGTGVQRQEQKTLQGEIQRMESQFQMAMPKGQEATRLVRDALTCLRQTPKLQECQWSTVLGSLMTCAQLGLRPGVLGHAYLLPFWNSKAPRPDGRGEGAYQAQLVLGYQGLIELAYRSGMVESIAARTVYSNDEFLVEYGSDPKWIHRPALGGSRGEPILFYAEAKMRGGGYVFTDPMTVADMETYRDKHATAKAKGGRVFGPWVDHFEGMAHKTMVRKLMKMLPKSTEVAQAITHDGAIRIDPTPAGIDATPDYIDGTVEEDTTPPADSTPAEGNQDTGSGNPPQEQQPPQQQAPSRRPQQVRRRPAQRFAQSARPSQPPCWRCPGPATGRSGSGFSSSTRWPPGIAHRTSHRAWAAGAQRWRYWLRR